jgi:hypothetical protein
MISQHFLSPDIYGFIADIAGLALKTGIDDITGFLSR